MQFAQGPLGETSTLQEGDKKRFDGPTADGSSVDERLRSIYSRGARRYDERRYFSWKGNFKKGVLTDLLVNLVGPTPSTRILDVATGTGTAALPLAERGAQVIGVDLVLAMMMQARSKAREQGTPDLPFVQGNARVLPFADGTFDVATCVMLFHLLPRNMYGVTLDEILRVLKPGGVAVIEYANPFHGLIAELFRVLFQGRRVSYLWPWEIRRLSPNARVTRIRGTYLPLTQAIARWNRPVGRMLVNAGRVFPLNRLCSELFIVARKGSPDPQAVSAGSTMSARSGSPGDRAAVGQPSRTREASQPSPASGRTERDRQPHSS